MECLHVNCLLDDFEFFMVEGIQWVPFLAVMGQAGLFVACLLLVWQFGWMLGNGPSFSRQGLWPLTGPMGARFKLCSFQAKKVQRCSLAAKHATVCMLSAVSNACNIAFMVGWHEVT